MPSTVSAEDAGTVEGRLSEAAKYLSSDELEGRGVGTKGLDLAADFIAQKFREIGLKTDLVRRRAVSNVQDDDRRQPGPVEPLDARGSARPTASRARSS